MSKLQFNVQNDIQKATINLSGQIDESFPPELLAIKFGPEVIINLDQIKMINSLGIREWIKFIGVLSQSKVEFIKCPKIFIDQVNMVQGFITPNCKIKSFYVPYFNEDTSNEKNVLYAYGQEYGDGFLNVKASIVAEDGTELEIDVVEQKYFKFLKV
ncbi:MAG: hypothetical protein ACK4VO_03510 [Pseudobdellovibrio sp.]